MTLARAVSSQASFAAFSPSRIAQVQIFGAVSDGRRHVLHPSRISCVLRKTPTFAFFRFFFLCAASRRSDLLRPLRVTRVPPARLFRAVLKRPDPNASTAVRTARGRRLKPAQGEGGEKEQEVAEALFDLANLVGCRARAVGSPPAASRGKGAATSGTARRDARLSEMATRRAAAERRRRRGGGGYRRARGRRGGGGTSRRRPPPPPPPGARPDALKRCAAHVYIAHFIDYRQRIGPVLASPAKPMDPAGRPPRRAPGPEGDAAARGMRIAEGVGDRAPGGPRRGGTQMAPRARRSAARSRAPRGLCLSAAVRRCGGR